jgi:hypothetical protein
MIIKKLHQNFKLMSSLQQKDVRSQVPNTNLKAAGGRRKK